MRWSEPSTLDFEAPRTLPPEEREQFDAVPDSHRYFLWPVAVYRVVAVPFESGELDLFADTVLKLKRDGKHSAQEIGTLLNLQPSLIERIVDELIAQALLDPAGLPVPGAITAHRTTLGEVMYLFRDPRTRAFLPQHKREPLPEIALRKAGANEYRLPVEPRGRPKNALAIRPEPTDFASPGPAEVAAAFEASVEQARVWAGVTGFGSEDVLRDQEIARVDLIEVEPYPAFVVTCAWMTPERAPNWSVCDPFGRGISEPVQARLQELSTADKDLANWLAPLASARARGASPVLADLARRAAAARSRIETQWPAARAHTEVENELLQMEIGLLGVEEIMSATEGTSEERHELAIGPTKIAMFSAQNALEAMLEEVRLRPRLEAAGAWRSVGLVEGSSVPNAALLEGLAASIGFATDDLASLWRLPLKKIEIAADRGAGTSLNGRLLAGLIAARLHPPDGHTAGHPFWAAAMAYPNLLRDLHDLAYNRDRVAHATGYSISADDLQEYRNVVYRALRSVLSSEGTREEVSGGART